MEERLSSIVEAKLTEISNLCKANIEDLSDRAKTIQNHLELATLDALDLPEKIENATEGLVKVSTETREELQLAVLTLATSSTNLQESLKSTPNPTNSYALVTARTIPPSNASRPAAPAPPPLLAKVDLQARRVLLDKSPSSKENILSGLSERELTEKGNCAIDIMRKANPETDVEFDAIVVGASKLRNGGVMLEFGSPEAATLIRSNAQAFSAALGHMAIIKTKEWPVMAEYVPITHDPDSEHERLAIETNSGLPPGSIASSKWIKPLSRRTSSQQNAHLIVRFTSIDAANTALCNGLLIGYRRVTLRKLGVEPRRCLKCQTFTNEHSAADCPNAHDTCATCGAHHRSSICKVTEEKNYFCNNCNVKGHAAWSRECPLYKEEKEKARSRAGKTDSYRFFPASEEWTWQTLGPKSTVTPKAGTGGQNPASHSTWFEDSLQEQAAREAKKASFTKKNNSKQANAIGKPDNGWGAKAKPPATDPPPATTHIHPERQSRLSPFLTHSADPDPIFVRSSVTPDIPEPHLP
jgi:hypothetical protein